MPRSAKRLRSGSQTLGSVDEAADEQLRAVKRERVNANAELVGAESAPPIEQNAAQRRLLRSDYLAVKNLISEKRDDLMCPNSEKFNQIFNKVEKLHQQVQKPREQVVDAEALLDITSTLWTSVKSQSSAGINPSDFINCLLSKYRKPNSSLAGQDGGGAVSIMWNEIGLEVAPIFKRAHGCCTMLGPMSNEVKERKAVVRTRRTKPTTTDKPDEVSAEGEEKTDTDKNMATMFDILRKKKRVRLEGLILNRTSFAQTVENLFALSFLVKDGRAEITVDANRAHFVAPRNAPAANLVASREVVYNHFAFRFDFKDWKLMKDLIPVGEELMPHRSPPSDFLPSSLEEPAAQAEPAAYSSQTSLPTTPIRKLSRNRGRVVLEESVVEESPENDDADAGTNAVRRSKRKL